MLSNEQNFKAGTTVLPLLGDDAPGYAGNVSPTTAYEALKASDAILVDVRTRPEWMFVGIPDLSGLGKEAALIEWQEFPQMNINQNFISVLQNVASDKSAPTLFLCRSGVRSAAAAQAATAAGYELALNIANGFEGDPDAMGHRGKSSGWKAEQMPWVQN